MNFLFLAAHASQSGIRRSGWRPSPAAPPAIVPDRLQTLSPGAFAPVARVRHFVAIPGKPYLSGTSVAGTRTSALGVIEPIYAKGISNRSSVAPMLFAGSVRWSCHSQGTGYRFKGPLARGGVDRGRGGKSPQGGVPSGSRTRVAAVKGRCPRPLDDGDRSEGEAHGGVGRHRHNLISLA